MSKGKSPQVSSLNVGGDSNHIKSNTESKVVSRAESQFGEILTSVEEEDDCDKILSQTESLVSY